MTAIQYALIYLATIPIFLVIDLAWLGFFAKNFYNTHLGSFLGPVNWYAAILFYLLFIIGVLIFAVIPALNASSIIKAITLGALFGFLSYATYDLTNLATMKDWPLIVTVVDMIWGSVLSSSVAACSYWIAKTFII